jgi:hypothetical protein
MDECKEIGQTNEFEEVIYNETICGSEPIYKQA